MRTIRNFSLSISCVVVFPFFYSKLALYLCNVYGRNLESVFIANISLYIIVCCFVRLNSKFFDIQIYADMSVDFFVT